MTAAPVALRDAATVMLVRDGAAGLEVFMLRRNLQSDFVGGAYVFPGGAVDEEDCHADLEPLCEGRTDREASAVLGIDGGGLAFWVAAIRECFEEAGVLLAYERDGVVIRLDDPAVEARFVEHRRRVDQGERRLVDICAEEGLRLAVDAMHYFSHWITPEGAPRRYDTRFFLARAPEAQVGLHDDRETIANTWIRPAEALERHGAGDFELIFPTIRNLTALARFDDTDTLIAAAAAASTDVPTILPRVVHDAGGTRIVLPGDPGYEEALRAPTVEFHPIHGVTPVSDPDAPDPSRRPLVPGVASVLTPLVRRILAPNPGPMTGPGTNTYLVGIDEIVVVDPGPADDTHLDAIAGCGGDRIRWILATHTHADHSPGVAGLRARTGAEVLAFASRDGLEVDTEIGDGDRIEATEFRLTAVHTPGHASNHLCFLLEEERVLFSGDHIMQGSTVVIRPPDGDMAAYLESLERLRQLRLKAILPGHGHLIADPQAKIDEYVEHRLAREREVLATLEKVGASTIAPLVAEIYPGLVDVLVPMAAHTVHAHLIKLAADGKVAGEGAEDEWRTLGQR